MRDADLYTGYTIVIEAASPEEIGNGFIFKIGVGQNTVQRRSLRQVVDITQAVLFQVAELLLAQ